jgi:predicted secreted protein
MAKLAAKGTILAYLSATGPDVYSTIPGVQDFDFPLGEKEEIDVTSHDSSGNYDETVLGIATRAAFDVPIVWDGTNTHHAALVTRHGADTATTFKITAKDTKTYTFSGLIKNISLSFPVRGAQVASVSIKPTGATTIA